jgi:hypothetical protein
MSEISAAMCVAQEIDAKPVGVFQKQRGRVPCGTGALPPIPVGPVLLLAAFHRRPITVSECPQIIAIHDRIVLWEEYSLLASARAGGQAVNRRGALLRALLFSKPSKPMGRLDRLMVQDVIYDSVYTVQPAMTNADRPLSPQWFQILLALANHDLHGLAITKEVFERTEGQMHLWPGMLYGALRKMADSGLVDEVDAPRAARDHA